MASNKVLDQGAGLLIPSLNSSRDLILAARGSLSPGCVMIGRFPSKLSLEWKLPAVIGGLLLLVIVALSSAAYLQATRSARAAAGVRLSSVADQLAGLLTTSARQLRGRVQSMANQDTLRSYVLSPDIGR